MLYQKAKIKNGQIIIISSEVIDQSKLTAGCWRIQFDGLITCRHCEFLNTKNCGGKFIRKTLVLCELLNGRQNEEI